MDYNGIIQVAENKLQDEKDILNDLRDQVASGSTGGEISLLVGRYLKNLKYKNLPAYLKIENEVEQYFDNCEKQGLYIR